MTAGTVFPAVFSFPPSSPLLSTTKQKPRHADWVIQGCTVSQGKRIYMGTRRFAKETMYSDFSSLLLFPQRALPMGKSQCWCDAGAICALRGLKARTTTFHVWAFGPWLPRVKKGLADRTHSSAVIKVAEIILLDQVAWSQTDVTQLFSRLVLTLSLCSSHHQGRNEEGVQRSSVAKAAVFAWIYWALALLPSTAFRGNSGTRLANDINGVDVKPLWERHYVQDRDYGAWRQGPLLTFFGHCPWHEGS